MRTRLLAEPLALACTGAVLAGTLRLRDPHQPGSYGSCPVLALTGWACPGCGGLRAVNDLTHGNVAAAVGSNALAILALALLGVLWVRWLVRRGRGQDVPLAAVGGRATVVAVVALLAFAVLRNTAWGSVLAP